MLLFTDFTVHYSMPYYKLRTALCAAALLLILATASSAQTVCSTASATPAFLRAEGLTEQIADIAISCTASSVSTVNVTVFVTPATTITSKVLDSATGKTEALAITNSGIVNGVATGSSIIFTGITGPAAAFTITLTNIRVNASVIPAGGIGAVPAPLSVQAFVAGTNVTPVSTNQIVAGYLVSGLAPPASQSVSYSACSNLTPSTGPAFLVRFAESFPNAFKTRGGSSNSTLGSEFTANTETGYYQTLGVNTNQADSATRIRVLFSNVPAGISVYIPVILTGTTSAATAPTAALTASQSGAFSAVPAVTPSVANGLPASPALAQVAIANGAGEADYEITAQNPASIDFFGAPVYLNGTAALLTSAASPVTATVSLAPLSAATIIPAFSGSAVLTYTYNASATCIPISAILPSTVPLAVQGMPYAQVFTVNGSGNITWSVSAGTLPASMALNSSTGLLSGTPSASATSSFTVKAVDGASNSATQAITLQVNPPLSATPIVLPAATQGSAYTHQAITLAGGTGLYALGSFTPPPGMSLDVTTGILSGTPTTSGLFAFTVPVTDSGGGAASAMLSLQVNAPPALCGNPVLPSGPIFARAEGTSEQLADMTFTCAGTGGTTDVQVSLSPALPITSKVLNAATRLTEATLITPSGSTSGTLNAAGTQLTFAAVVIPAGNVSVNIANVRANVTSVTGSAGAPPPVNETVTLTGIPAVLPTTKVAVVVTGIGAQTIGGLRNYATCSAVTATPGPAFSLQFSESFAAAFKSRGDSTNNVPGSGATNNTETAYYVTSGGVNNQASSATRVKVVFTNVPAGLSVYVPLTLSTAGGTLTLTTSESGVFAAVSAIAPSAANTLPNSPAVGQVTIANGTGTAVYEVTTQNPAAIESYTMPVYVSGASVTASANPITATISFAPAGAAANIPSFAILSSSTPLTASAFASCLTVSTTTLPGAAKNSAYSGATLAATGGTLPYTWSLASGALPLGLSLNTSTGAITGTPTATAPAFTVQVTDSGSPVQTAMQSLTIAVVNPFSAITPIPNGIANSPYSAVLVQGGTPPYTCSTTSALPAGLTLTSSTCTLAGTTHSGGQTPLQVMASDSSVPALTLTVNGTLSIANPLQITTATITPLAATVTLSAAGGYPAYSHWTVSSGALPNGFTLNANTGVLSGNPAAVTGGPFTFAVTVQDSVGNVSPARTFSTAALTTTTTGLGLSANPPLYGQALTLAAAVTPSTATGQVTFFDGVTVLGTVPLSGGGAAFSTPLLASGTHSLRAFYVGNTAYSASVSAATVTTVSSGAQTGFAVPVNTATGLAASSAIVADFNGDDFPDLVVSAGPASAVLLNNHDGTFRQSASLSGVRAIAGDFNGDGNPDLALANSTLGTLSIALGNGDGTFQTPVSYATAIGQAFLSVADVNGDGIADIVTAGGVISTLIGNGDGTFFAGSSTGAASGPYTAVVTADFNADGLADVAASSAAGTTVVFIGKGDGTFQPPVTYAGANAAISVADFNGDGVSDLATGAGILPGRGDGTFTALIPYPAALTGNVSPGDFNGDAKIDLLVTGTTSGATTSSILIGKGDGTFQAPVSYTTGSTPSYGVVADFNADGTTDIAVANSTGINVLSGIGQLSVTCNPSSGPTVTGTVYTSTCSATGGTPPYNFTIGSGTLPAGLSFIPGTATITGTPTSAGVYGYGVTVSDSSNPVLSATVGFAGIIQVPGGGTGGTGGGGGGTGGGGGGTGGPPASTLSVSPAALTFTSVSGLTPAPQTVMLTSTVAGSHFVSGVSTTGGSWLSATPNSGATDTQNTLTISVDPSNLGQGTYMGTVALITDKGGVASVLVTLTVQSQVTVSPTSLAFTYQKGDPQPAAQSLSVFSTPSGQSFNVAGMQNGSESWLSVSTNDAATPGNVTVSVNPGPLAPGSYSATIVVTSGGPAPVNVPVSLTVTKPALPPAMSISPGSETFNLTQGGAPASGQFTVSNTGGGSLQFTALSATAQGTWLSLNATTGTATPGAPGSLGFTVDPSGLSPGIYNGAITVTAANSTAPTTLAIMLTVSAAVPSISLSQTALTFQAVLNGQTPPPQTFTITGVASPTVQAQVVANPAAPGVNWLSATTSSGIARVSVNLSGLPAGQYYGSVSVAAPNAVNSPQSVSVFLNVSTNGTINVSPGGLIFTASSSQQVTLFNPTNASVTYSANTSAATWLTVSPASGTLLPGANTLTVTTDFSTLASGLQTAVIKAAFSDGSAANIQVDAIATGGNSVTTGQAFNACPNGTPTFLIPIFRKPLDQAFLQADVPQTVQLQIVNDCGRALTAATGGTAQVVFGSRDTALDLHDTGSGIWEATWNPLYSGMLVSLQAAAAQKTGALQGSAGPINVTVVTASVNAPAQITGVVNAASSAKATPQIVSPGSYVAIYGTGMSLNGNPNTTSIPLPTTLNGTQLLLGDKPLPLLYAGPGQVNALIPQALNSNTAYPLVVVRGATRSVPIPITVTTYQPAIYSLDLSGSGQGIVEIVGTTQLAGPTPAKRGSDYLSIFCTGLGPVQGTNGEAPPADGNAAPLTVLYKTVGTVTATVGGVNAPVVFAGLTPSLVGLYQVNIQVPAGASAGTAVPVVINVMDPVTLAITQSNSVTVALQ